MIPPVAKIHIGEQKMKLVRLCKDTFTRGFGDIGYVINQLTKHDRVYDEVGRLFLEKVTRSPVSINSIISDMHPFFTDVSRIHLEQDFVEFVEDMEKDMFFVTGETENELNQKECVFSYQMENPKTITYNFLCQDSHSVQMDTSDFLHEYFRQNPTLFGMEMEVTSRCNERCLHCYIPHEHKTKDIESSLVHNVLDQLKELRTVQVSFSGGELCLHKHIAEMLTHARKNDFMITVLSNGTLLNDEIISVLKETNINLIQISLYSMKPEEHDAITRLKGSYRSTIKAIEKLLAEDIPLQISCPVMKLNVDSYKDVLRWAASHKVKAYTDFIMMARTDFTTSNLDHRLDLNETERLIGDIIKYDDGYQTCLDLEPKSKNMERYADQPVCGVGMDNICVTADGSLYPCAGFQGYILGNAYDRPLKEIWEQSERLQFLRTINNASFPRCMRCGAKDYCAMCLVRNFNESGGDMFKVNNHFCDVAFLNKRLVEEFKKKSVVALP
jgi:radical SAM protein with 4Fe4S-binding SPASM domain